MGAPPSLSLDVSAIVPTLRDLGPEAFAFAFVSALGALVLARMLMTFLGGVARYFLRPGKNLRKSYGEWAVVTGATDGIGKAFAEQLAARRLNVVLVSRTQAKLDELAKALEGKYKVQTRVLAIDFAQPGPATWRAVSECVAPLDVGILINNCGMSYPHAEFLHQLDEATEDQIIAVNVQSTTKMIRAVLPKLLEKKRGAVVNIGSGAATVLPSDPLYSVYAATKGYVDQLTRSLAVEYAGKGVHFQLQAPLYVATKMAKIRSASLTVPSATTFAKAALSQIGYETVLTPYWVHAMMWSVLSTLPTAFIDGQRLKMCLSIRKRAYKKKELAAKSQ